MRKTNISSPLIKNIVNKAKGTQVMKPGKHQRNKQRGQDLCWKVHNPAQSFFFHTRTLCMSYVTNTFLLVISLVRNKQLIVFCAGSRPKNRTITYNKEL